MGNVCHAKISFQFKGKRRWAWSKDTSGILVQYNDVFFYIFPFFSGTKKVTEWTNTGQIVINNRVNSPAFPLFLVTNVIGIFWEHTLSNIFCHIVSPESSSNREQHMLQTQICLWIMIANWKCRPLHICQYPRFTSDFITYSNDETTDWAPMIIALQNFSSDENSDEKKRGGIDESKSRTWLQRTFDI